jgi:hypothetical protein
MSLGAEFKFHWKIEQYLRVKEPRVLQRFLLLRWSAKVLPPSMIEGLLLLEGLVEY